MITGHPHPLHCYTYFSNKDVIRAIYIFFLFYLCNFFLLSVYIFIFNKNVFISFLFHLFFLILTCSCPYSYNLMLTATSMCRPYILIIHRAFLLPYKLSVLSSNNLIYNWNIVKSDSGVASTEATEAVALVKKNCINKIKKICKLL